MSKVAVVTGSNKGIGLAIVKGLVAKFEGDVYLTSRSEERGLAALEELKKEGIVAKFHQLDINSRESIEQLRDFIKEKYGGLDVLVNNAGIAFKSDATESFAVQAKVTIATNYFSVKDTCEILFPLLRDGARVVNVSSSAGYLGRINGQEPEAGKLRAKFASSDSTLSIEELSGLMNDFIASADAGNHASKGWPNSTYMTSKVGLSALTRLYQREFNKDSRKDLVINHIHPGYVDTDMTSHKGPLTVEQGARSSIFAALLPPGSKIRGDYLWHDCQVVNWVDGPLPSEF